jgi:hypothetical protein
MLSTKHVRDLATSYEKRIGLVELRLSKLPWVSEHPRLVIDSVRRVLNPFSFQDSKASIDGVQNTLGTFNVSWR